MPNTPICAENAVSPLERRRDPRREVLAIAYCDIGTDNGGIVINLSEGGLALQAAGPLVGQTNLNLKVRVPASQPRIEITAQIAWLDDSNRRAGVRFVEVSSEARARIDEWVQLNMSPPAPPYVVPRPLKVLGQQESNRKPGKNKRLRVTSMADAAVPESSATPVPKSQKETGGPPVEPDSPATHPEAKLALDLDQQTTPPHATRPGEISLVATSDQPHKELPKSGDDGNWLKVPSDLAAISEPIDDQISIKLVRDSIFPPYRTEPTAVHEPTTVPEPSRRLDTAIEHFSSSVDSEKDSAAELRSAILPLPAVAPKKSTRQWNRAIVLIGSFSLLTFVIGAWVGSSRSREHSVQTLTLPAATAPVIGASTTENNLPKANEPAPAIANRPHIKSTGGSPAPGNPMQNLKPPLPVSPLVPVSTARTSGAAASTAPVIPVREDIQPMSAERGITPPEATKPLGNSSPPAPIPDDSATEAPAPRIVAGQTLRPTDRFNPAHLTYRVEPAYPSEAQQQGIEGTVKLHLVIGADGTVRSVKSLSGSPLLTPAAMDAAKYWQYLPALLNGKSVESEEDTEIEFRLPHSRG